MTTRRAQILDAAISVLAREGARGVTHRAVDAEAGLPLGSTSNHFRSRAALLDGVVERFVEREREAFEQLAAATRPGGLVEMADVLAEWARTAVGARRELTLARFALLVESAIRPELRAALSAGAAEVGRWAESWARTVGSTDPARDVHLLASHVDAVTLHQLARPDPAFDPAPSLRALAHALTAATAPKSANAPASEHHATVPR